MRYHVCTDWLQLRDNFKIAPEFGIGGLHRFLAFVAARLGGRCGAISRHRSILASNTCEEQQYGRASPIHYLYLLNPRPDERT